MQLNVFVNNVSLKYKYTYTFQISFVHSNLTSLQCKESMQNFSYVVIDIKLI